MDNTPRYRQFLLSVVPDDKPNSDGRWIERVVPDEWPGDDRAQKHMMKTPPDYDYVPFPGYHVVAIQETVPGPCDQPGTMAEAAGFKPGAFDDPPAPSFGMR